MTVDELTERKFHSSRETTLQEYVTAMMTGELEQLQLTSCDRAYTTSNCRAPPVAT